ncbi:LacI family DNA-binding transcriptional regulator [Glaciecola sp. 2405UD65-10]|uniref:LacI family DNA-binding transcriptional regulator n=1 Tax=Glaciecola sp. 2405UD65-10 TaxID=3397244 RepID=UPI003B5AA280
MNKKLNHGSDSKAATIYQVAKLAGCAVSTVSRVVNKHQNVSSKTKEKVHSAMAQLNYRPNTVASSLASQRSNCVGVLVSELASEFFGTFTGAVESVLREHNKHIIVTAGHGDAASEKEGINFLIDRNCDALILHVEALSDEYLNELCQGDIPIVIVNRELSDFPNNCIGIDNELGGFKATSKAIEFGHCDIAYISGPLKKHDAHARWDGHLRALAQASIAYDPALFIEAEFSQESGAKALLELLAQNKPFSCVVCGNDEIACGVMSAARDAKMHLPNALSIVGFDNSNVASYTYPKLSSVDYPIAQIGKAAGLLVLKHVYVIEAATAAVPFSPTFINRASLQSKL